MDLHAGNWNSASRLLEWFFLTVFVCSMNWEEAYILDTQYGEYLISDLEEIALFVCLCVCVISAFCITLFPVLSVPKPG